MSIMMSLMMLSMIFVMITMSAASVRRIEPVSYTHLDVYKRQEQRRFHQPSELSGGQKQRVAIARSLVNDPAILLADEPTGALDSATSRQIMELLASMNQRGITMVVVTHDDNVASYCSRRIFLQDGKVLPD